MQKPPADYAVTSYKPHHICIWWNILRPSPSNLTPNLDFVFAWWMFMKYHDDIKGFNWGVYQRKNKQNKQASLKHTYYVNSPQVPFPSSSRKSYLTNSVKGLGCGWWDEAGTQIHKMKKKNRYNAPPAFISCSYFVLSYLSHLVAACSPTCNAQRCIGWLVWRMKDVLEIGLVRTIPKRRGDK